jgi:hypothetical protein
MMHTRLFRGLATGLVACLLCVAAPIAPTVEGQQSRPGGQATAKPRPAQPATRPAAPARAAAPPAPKVERPVPFAPGETFTYDVSWSMGFLTAGTATLRVVDKHASYGSLAYYILGEGRPTPALAKLYSLYYKADSLLDVYSLTSQRGSVYSDENGRRRMKSLRFNPDGKTALFEMQTSTNMKRDLRVPAQSQDALSALFALRAMALSPGMTVRMPVCVSDAVYTMSALVVVREDVKTSLGTQRALKIRPMITDAAGNSAGRGLVLWLSDDAKKVPLRLQTDLAVGSFNLVLREAKYQ